MLYFNSLIKKVLNGDSTEFIEYVNKSHFIALNLSESLETFYIDELFDAESDKLIKIKRLADALKCTPEVQALKFFSCHFQYEWIVQLFSDLKDTNIKIINLCNNFLREENISIIIRKTKETKLSSLDLTDCIQFSQYHRHDPKNISKIADALAESPLTEFKIYHLTQKGIEAIKKRGGDPNPNAQLASKLDVMVRQQREMIEKSKKEDTDDVAQPPQKRRKFK